MQPRVHIQGTPSFSIVFTCKAVRAEAWLRCIVAPTASTNMHMYLHAHMHILYCIAACRNTPLGTQGPGAHEQNMSETVSCLYSHRTEAVVSLWFEHISDGCTPC